MFSVKSPKPTFRSYLPPLQTDGKTTVAPSIKKLEPTLLPGEIVVNEALFVKKCIGAESSQNDLWGKLICTNFKVSFIPQDAPPKKQKSHLSHVLLGEHDIPLTCLEQVVTVNDTKGKKKVLGSNQKLKFNPTELILYLKDWRIIRFCFHEAGPETSKKVCLAIAHYSHPADLQLLFGFEYQGRRYHEAKEHVNGSNPKGGLQTPIFDCPSDWDREIKRTGASEWRVCSINEHYGICSSLPEHFVVPVSLADQDLKQYASFFTDGRLPIWCWNHPNGSALIRISSITEQLGQRKFDQRIFNAIKKSHPLSEDLIRADMDKNLPNIQDIQSAFVKLKQHCILDPFDETEEKWLTNLENTRWLEYVRMFLKQAAEIVYFLDGKNASVLLQEEEDRDLNCVVSSLVQIMLDPHYRTLIGFQSLVQKEWVMAGHRFLERCNHLKKNDKEESPLFTLFLDCVWQVMNQYSVAFEFSEVYLILLNDSMWVPLFSTFLFSSPKHHAQVLMEFIKNKAIPQREDQSVVFPPVWEWSQQFSNREQTLFSNLLFVGRGAAAVQKGEVKNFRRIKKTYSSSVRGTTTSQQNGQRAQEIALSRRGSLITELKSEFSPVKDESPSERYFRDWFSRSVNMQGLLIPVLLPTHVVLWKLFFLRWVPESCIPKGGPAAYYNSLSQLANEIETLQSKVRQYKGPVTENSPLPSPSGSPSDKRGVYLKASSPDDPPTDPDLLTSSFPFNPVGNLCWRSVQGTPISKFLTGAKTWLSTETLTNENF
ncbi:myotubularin-related protein 10 isoform X2 [Kryptolebias marmoratus]|uniref:myotubularin-related protein 10 isoform X2 n=1 Tax=Kryptolebias marmoratus TaxID=37003 RepID=UPI0007F91106|nr:myotubularin-related protein 10 isoform X2 [Kryptolebias marmoratus]